MFDFGIKRNPVVATPPAPAPEGIILDLQRRNASRFPDVTPSENPDGLGFQSLYYDRARLLNSLAFQAGNLDGPYLMLANPSANGETLYVSNDDVNYSPAIFSNSNFSFPIRIAHNANVILVCQPNSGSGTSNGRFAWSRDGINYTVSSNTLQQAAGDSTSRNLVHAMCVNNIFFIFTSQNVFYTGTFDPDANGGVGQFTFQTRTAPTGVIPRRVAMNAYDESQIGSNANYVFTTGSFTTQALISQNLSTFFPITVPNGVGLATRAICWNGDENKFVIIDQSGRLIEGSDTGFNLTYIKNLPIGVNGVWDIFYDDIRKGYICAATNTQRDGRSVVFTMNKDYENLRSYILENNPSFTSINSARYNRAHNEVLLAYAPRLIGFGTPNCQGSFAKANPVLGQLT